MTILQALDRQVGTITLNGVLISRDLLLSNNWEVDSDDTVETLPPAAEAAKYPTAIPFMPEGIQSQQENPNIKTFGCFFLVCIKYGELLRNRAVGQQEIDDLYASCLRDGIIERNTFVNDSRRIANRVLNEVRFRPGRKDIPAEQANLKALETLAPIHIVRLFRPRDKATHFVLRIWDGSKWIIWDSLPPNRASNTGYEETRTSYFLLA